MTIDLNNMILLQAQSTVANLPATGYANYRIINAVPCNIDLYGKKLKNKNFTVSYKQVRSQ